MDSFAVFSEICSSVERLIGIYIVVLDIIADYINHYVIT